MMWVLLQHEVKYYFKNKYEVIYLYSYFISIIMISPFVGSADAAFIKTLAPLALWIALTSAVALGAQALFRRDYEQGRLEYYQILPISLEYIVFIKWLGFFLLIILPLLAVLPVASLLFGLDGRQWPHYAVGLAAGSAGLTIISTLVAAVTIGMEKAGAIISLIILPLSIPLIIVGGAYCHDISSLWQPHLAFMLGMAAFLLPPMCLIGAHSIRSAN